MITITDDFLLIIIISKWNNKCVININIDYISRFYCMCDTFMRAEKSVFESVTWCHRGEKGVSKNKHERENSISK